MDYSALIWMTSWAMLIGIIYLVYKVLSGLFSAGGSVRENGSMICPACGTRGEPKTITRGSILIEIILWLCLIIPGLIYSIWRLTTRQKGCPSCSGIGMISVNSPVGKRLIGNAEK